MVLHLFISRTYLHASLELISFKEACKYKLHSDSNGLLLNPVEFTTLTMLGDRSFHGCCSSIMEFIVLCDQEELLSSIFQKDIFILDGQRTAACLALSGGGIFM